MSSTALVGLSSQAMAACLPAGGANFICSDAETVGQTIVLDNADVSTSDGFSVDTDGAATALSITGNGAIRYSDANASALSGGPNGLVVRSLGDVGGTPGSVFVETAGDIHGDNTGLVVENAGTGAIDVTALGTVSGGLGFLVSSATGSGIRLATGSAHGLEFGIVVGNDGFGATDVFVAGDVSTAPGGVAAILINHTASGNVMLDIGGSVEGPGGVYVNNLGQGESDVIVAGPVIGRTGAGISVMNGVDAGGVFIVAVDVSGQTDGIEAVQRGSNSAQVLASGHVEGGRYGIRVLNEGDWLTDVVAESTVGGDIGIFAENGVGAANLSLQVNRVQGGQDGIRLVNMGTGDTDVWVYGWDGITGADGVGLAAFGGVNTTAMTLNSGPVSGGTLGIDALYEGAGAMLVRARGHVEGGEIGIRAETFGNELVIEAVTVTGEAVAGIQAINRGAGVTSVTATGHVEGGGDGIYVLNEIAATDLTVVASTVTSGGNGIAVTNRGTGATFVSATGRVEGGNNSNGIVAVNRETATTLTVEAASAFGDDHGIAVFNSGTGATSVRATGEVVGSVSAIWATAAGHAITITNDGGLFRHLSGRSWDMAVRSVGGPTVLANSGEIIGTVLFGADPDIFENAGTWSAAGGTSDFGGGGDAFVNQAGGVVIGALDGTAAEITEFTRLESFANSGLVALADGGAGDVLRTDAAAVFTGPAATFAVDVDASGASDIFVADGGISLVGGPTLEVNVVDGLRLGHRYTVMSTLGALGGTFGTIEGVTNTAFLAIEDVYDANNAYLDVVQFRDFADAALTPNQIATAQGLDSLPGGVLFDAVIGLPDDIAAQFAFDQFSGDIHASVAGTLLQDSRVLRDAATNRLRAVFDTAIPSLVPVLAYGPGGPEIEMDDSELFALWGNASGGWGHRDGDGNAAGLETDARHLTVGADGFVGDWRLGVLAGYGNTAFTAPDRASSVDADSYHLGIYGGRAWDALAFRTGFVHSWHDVTATRSVAFPGFAETLEADYGARTAQIFGELAYGIDAELARFEPFANLAYVRHTTDGYTETGGAAALTSSESVFETTFATLGVRAETELVLGTVDARARGMIGWQHAFGDVTPLTSHAFAGGSAFTIAGAPIARNAALVELGLDLSLTPTATLELSYGGQFAADDASHAFKASLGVKF